MALAIAALSSLLHGCAAPAAKPPRDVQTESDQTDADRRARVRLELAAAYFTRGQGATALDEIKMAVQAKPDFPEAFNLRGLIYASLGEPALAEDSFRRALQLNSHDADAMHNYGWFLCQQNRFADAEAQFNAAMAETNYRDLTRTLMAKGVCQARNNQWADAERTLLKAYELDPANPTTAVNLAEVLLRRGELERARFYIGRVNANDDLANAQTIWLAVRIEQKLGQDSRVKLLGNQLVNRFPQSPEALLFEKGRFDD